MGVIIVILSIVFVIWLLGKALESDLKDLEKTNPKFRQYLKDKYYI